METFDSVLSAASQLSVDDRLRLIDELASSVPDDHPPALSPEWMAEIERRYAAFQNGEVKTVPWEVVKQQSRDRARNRNRAG